MTDVHSHSGLYNIADISHTTHTRMGTCCIHIEHLEAALSSLAKSSLLTLMSSTMASITSCAEAAASSELVEVEMRDMERVKKSSPACSNGMELIAPHYTEQVVKSTSLWSHYSTWLHNSTAVLHMSCSIHTIIRVRVRVLLRNQPQNSQRV